MLSTRLILIEGLPGAGKSTATVYLEKTLRDCGWNARGYREQEDPHPLPCLDYPIQGLPGRMIPLWERFVQQAAVSETITIIESRLWQNTALFMYLSECPPESILAFNRQLAQALAPLSPVLIYLDQRDVRGALDRLRALRGEAWTRSTMAEMAAYAWFRSRACSGFDAWVNFFEDWHRLAGRLYRAWPEPKLRLVDAQADYSGAYRKLGTFLQLRPEG